MTQNILSYIFSFLLIISCVSCKQDNTKNKEFKIKKDKNTISIKIEEKNRKYITLKPENIHGIFSEILVANSLLFCGNMRSEKLINIYSLKNKKFLNEILSRGTEPNEGLSVAGLNIQDNSKFIWLYDITLGKMFKINLYKSIKDTTHIVEKEIILVDKLKNLTFPSVINDSIFLATTYSIDDCRYFYTNTKKITKKIGNLPTTNNDEYLIDPPNTKFPNKAFLFKAISVKHPTKNKVAVFYNKLARTEFYSNDRILKIVNNEKDFNPRLQVTKIEKGFSVEDCSETKYAYLSVSYTADYIYALYSGNTDTCSNRIFVFNWDGNFIKELILNKQVCKINVDSEKKILYCYEKQEKGICSTSLNFE